MFISLIVLPAYFIGIIQWRSDMNTCQTAARNFVDMVIDNGKISERAMTDLNLSIASCSSNFTYEYYREEKVVNPDPSDASKYITTWVHKEVDTDTEWQTGDICTIVVTQKSMNIFQRLSMALLGSSYNNIEIRLSGMVR
jgi:hypothetical protein